MPRVAGSYVLESLGIVRETTGQKNRAYSYQAYVALLTGR